MSMSSSGPLPAGLPAEPETGMRPVGWAGMVAAVMMLAILIGWASVTRIESAVTTSGQVIVRGKPKVVQSLDGGIVEEIRVRNGDAVTAGQILLRLDPTLIEVNLGIARNRLAEALATRARLEAEDLGRDAPRFAYDPLPFPLPAMQEPEEGQQRVFAARRELNAGRRSQLAEQLEQFARQKEGLDASIAAREEQITYLDRELTNALSLQGQGLIRESQVLQIQRSRAAMQGELAEARAERARVDNAAQNAVIEVEQAEREFREQVVTDLRAAQKEIEEMTLQIVTLSRQLDRVEVRAPSDGIVHELQMTTVGGVVPPNGTMLQIIPVAEGVELELRLDPREIDRAWPGQKVEIDLTAFDQRATPRLTGHVTIISPSTVVTTGATGAEQSFYRLGVALDQDQLARLDKGSTIVPGMPVEAFLETGDQTVMRYLVQPLTGQLMRAFREG